VKTVATPGYIAKAAEKGGPGLNAVAILAKAGAGGEPSMVVGDPSVYGTVKEDEGRTVKILAPFKFFAIRDDHPAQCDCGCGGGSIITLLLPEEY